MDLPLWLMPHTVSVEPLLGSGPYGDSYGPAVVVQCFREDRRQLVRNSEGDEILSETAVYCRLDQVAKFPIGTRVTYGTKVAYVQVVAELDDGGLGAWQHLQVNL